MPDTTINYLAATTTDCTNCSSQYYNMTKSSTDKFGSETSVYKVGNLTLEGMMGTDRVCIGTFDSSDLCMDEAEFLAVTKGWVDTNYDGFLGL